MSDRGVTLLILALGALLFSSCDDLAEPGELRQAAGPGEDPAGDGPFAVGWKRHVDVDRLFLPDFTMDVFFPSQETGAFDASSAPYPVVVFIQGDFVARAKYYWLADRLASWGFVVVLPGYPLALAALAPGEASAAVDRLEESMEDDTFWKGGLDLTRIAVGGHSLGGIVADWAVDGDDRFSVLYLLASYPASPEDVRFDGPVLSVAGQDDCDAVVSDVYAGFEAYHAPRVFASINGMTHYQFTASDDRDQDSCPPEIDLEAAHEKTSGVIVPFLKSYLADDSSFLPYLFSEQEGVTLEVDVGDTPAP